MVCGNFILPEPASYVFFYAFFNLRNLLYIIYQHRGQRYENRIRYYTQGERKKRNHRLITRGGAVESIAPEVRGMSERAFFLLMEKVFSLPEVAALVSQATDQQESG